MLSIHEQEILKEARNLIVKGLSSLPSETREANIYYNKVEKELDRIDKMKQYKAKLKRARNLLLDIQGHLIDEIYDEYNAKVDKFLGI